MPSIDLKDQCFGCEIEMTGLTRQQAAEAVASLFGTNAVHSRSSRTYDPWEVTDNEGKTWRFVYDSSIHGSHRTGRQQVPIGDGDYKVEMNSPKLEYSEMGKLQEVVRTLRHAGAVVNGSCGMHVHVDASKHTPQSLKNALLAGFDPLILKDSNDLARPIDLSAIVINDLNLRFQFRPPLSRKCIAFLISENVVVESAT